MVDVLVVGRGAPERGGIPSFLDLLVSGPLSDRCRLRLCNLADPATDPAGGRASWENVRRTLRDALRVWRSAAGVDIVHVHTAGAPTVTIARVGVLGLVARTRRARVIVHVHGGRTVELLAHRAGRLVARVALLPAHHVVAVAAGVQEALSRVVGQDRLSLVRNGVDLTRFRPATQPPLAGPPVVLYVGLLTPRKGVLDLFEASRRLRERGVRHEMWLAGGTPDEGSAAEREVREQAPDWVQWLGPRPPEEMPEIYGKADVFCLPSWWEGTPLTVLEAMASGLPVVATAVGDVPHLLADDVGTLVPPRDVAGLASALEPLLADVHQRERVGATARERAEAQLDITTTLAAVEVLYQKLAASGIPGRTR